MAGSIFIVGLSMTESMAGKFYKGLVRGSLLILQNLFSYYQSYFFKKMISFPLEMKGELHCVVGYVS